MAHLCPRGNSTCWQTYGHWSPLEFIAIVIITIACILVVFSILAGIENLLERCFSRQQRKP